MTLGLVAAAGCAAHGDDDGARPGTYEVRLGIIEHYGSSTDVMTVSSGFVRGVATEVVVRTYGGGCEEGWDEDLVVEDGVATLTPWDRSYVPAPPSGDVVEACTADLRRFEHRFEVVFEAAGDAVIRVRGRRVGGLGDSEKVLSVPVTVE